jgi:hypothetical protein
MKMQYEMKPLKELVDSYGPKDITKAVEFVGQAPLSLPSNLVLRVEMSDNTLHVYGICDGIGRDYKIGSLPEGMTFSGDRQVGQGREIGLRFGDIERVILHSQPYGTPVGTRSKRLPRSSTLPVESSPTLESRFGGPSESRATTRAFERRGDNYSGESRGGASGSSESRGSRSSESRGVRGSSESRGGGESRY